MRRQGLKENLHILLAPNEDGFGTSAWAVRLAKALLRRVDGGLERLIVAVSSERLVAFLENALDGCAGIEVFPLEGVTDRLELVKRRGGVDIARSLTRSVLSYPASRDEVRTALEKGGLLRDLDLVVDFGVPQVLGAVRARCDSGRRPTGAGREVWSVTVFDHMWSRTLEGLARSVRLPEPLWKKVSAALFRIRKDESSACEVFLLPDPVSPPWVGCAWKTLLGRPPRVLAGFPGGPLCTLEFVGDPAFRDLWQIVASGAPCPEEARSKARAHARRLLGIEDDAPILYVSGGGTGVWDELLTGLMDAYLKDPPCYSVVVYAPKEARRRKVGIRWHGNVLRSQWGSGQRIVFLDRVRGETHHVLFPGFNLALTRAGGGTVADCLACGVPMVLVEEPGMWQVEQIRLRCRELGLARAVSLDTFRAQPRTCVESRGGRLADLQAERKRILSLPNHGEIRLAESLMGSLTRPG